VDVHGFRQNLPKKVEGKQAHLENAVLGRGIHKSHRDGFQWGAHKGIET
jgi:hypothetical protein